MCFKTDSYLKPCPSTSGTLLFTEIFNILLGPLRDDLKEVLNRKKSYSYFPGTSIPRIYICHQYETSTTVIAGQNELRHDRDTSTFCCLKNVHFFSLTVLYGVYQQQRVPLVTPGYTSLFKKLLLPAGADTDTRTYNMKAIFIFVYYSINGSITLNKYNIIGIKYVICFVKFYNKYFYIVINYILYGFITRVILIV